MIELEIGTIEINKIKGPYNFQSCTTCLTKFNGSLGSLDKNFETNIITDAWRILWCNAQEACVIVIV